MCLADSLHSSSRINDVKGSETADCQILRVSAETISTFGTGGPFETSLSKKERKVVVVN